MDRETAAGDDQERGGRPEAGLGGPGGTDCSIVVPVGPGDEPGIAELAWLTEAALEAEVILSVTDLGRVPPGAPGRVVESGAGRAVQSNRGARAARGAWLWFMHVDSHPAAGALERVRALIGGGDALGYGWLRFREDGPWPVHLNAVGANLRSRVLGLPYGDQGLLLPHERFRALGGFREDTERGEDLDLVIRARRAGLPCRPIGCVVHTSARRYRQRGWLRTTAGHAASAARIAWRSWRERPYTR